MIFDKERDGNLFILTSKNDIEIFGFYKGWNACAALYEKEMKARVLEARIKAYKDAVSGWSMRALKTQIIKLRAEAAEIRGRKG